MEGVLIRTCTGTHVDDRCTKVRFAGMPPAGLPQCLDPAPRTLADVEVVEVYERHAPHRRRQLVETGSSTPAVR